MNQEKNQPRLIKWTPTLLSLMMILGAIMLGWNQVEFLKKPVMIGSGLFINACMMIGTFATLRAVQLKYISGAVIKGTITAGTFVLLWMMGTIVIDSVEKMIYRFVLMSTFSMGIYLIVTLSGKGSIVDDRFFDEQYMRSTRRHNPQSQKRPTAQRPHQGSTKKKPQYRPDIEFDISN